MDRWSKRDLPSHELHGLGLTPEEGFVLSRLDTPLSSDEVVALTGIDRERAEQILMLLARKGAIEPPEGTVVASPKVEVEVEGGVEVDGEASGGHERVDEGNHRAVYEAELRGLPRDARVKLATEEKGARLLALCFDPEPQVIHAVIANPASGLAHARLAARHHRNPAGLEAIAARSDLRNDPQLQKTLLRNAQLSEALAGRLLGGKRMLECYKVALDTDTPERTRQFARGVLRTKFAAAQGEERAGLLCATEGRVLGALTGLTLDARATQILCARTYTSPLFVQNLARFGSCPPPLLAHLLKQPIVRRQQHLKNMLLQHPNMPADAKRKV